MAYSPTQYQVGNRGENLRNLLQNMGIAAPPSMGMGELETLFANAAPVMGTVMAASLPEPATTVAANIKRVSVSAATLAGAGTGTLQMQAVTLAQGQQINNFNWLSGTTAGATLTHQWAALFTSARVLVATSADATSAAIAASTAITYPVATVASGAATSYTVPSTGVYYVGIMVANGSAQPTFSGNTTGPTAAACAIPPILYGPTTDTGLTAAPTFPFTAGAITATIGLAYVWLT